MIRAVVGIYVALIFVFAIYGSLWGDYAYKSFAYNFGRSLFWPGIIFPDLGKALGAVVVLGVVALLVRRA